MFKGGFGGGFNPNNLQNLMKQAQKMQADMEEAKNALNAMEFTGTAGGSMVEVLMSGDKKVKKVTLKEQVVDADDIEMLEDLVAAAVNDAIEKVNIAEKETVPQMPQGF